MVDVYIKIVRLVQQKSDYLVAMLIGLAWLCWAYTSGLKLSPDSCHYLSFALEMHDAGKLSVLPLWPPLYPFLVNLFMFAEPFPADAAAMLSGVSLAVLGIAFVAMLRLFSKNILTNTLYLLFLFVEIIFVYEYAWSETVFLPLCLIALLNIICHQRSGKYGYYLLAAAAAGATVLTRYLGYAMVGTFLLYTFFLIYRSRINRSNWERYVIASMFSYVPIALYLLRNQIMFGTLHGERLPSTTSFLQNLDRALAVTLDDLGILFIAVFAFSLLAWSLAAFLTRSRRANRDYTGAIVIVLFFSAVYIVELIYSTSRVSVDPIHTRMMVPVYIGMFLCIFGCFSSLGSLIVSFLGKWKTILRTAPAVLLCLVGVARISDLSSFIKGMESGLRVTDSGFNQGASASALASFFEDALSISENLNVSAVGYRANRPDIGSAMFLRRATLASRDSDTFSFTDVTNRGVRYTLSFEDNGVTKNINYLPFPGVENREDFTKAIEETLHKEEIDSFLLVIDKYERYHCGSNLHRIVSKQFHLGQVFESERYAVYRIKAGPTFHIGKELSVPQDRVTCLTVKCADLSEHQHGYAKLLLGDKLLQTRPFYEANYYVIDPAKFSPQCELELKSDGPLPGYLKTSFTSPEKPIVLDFNNRGADSHRQRMSASFFRHGDGNLAAIPSKGNIVLPTLAPSNAVFIVYADIECKEEMSSQSQLNIEIGRNYLHKQPIKNSQDDFAFVVNGNILSKENTEFRWLLDSTEETKTNNAGSVILQSLPILRKEPAKSFRVDIGEDGDQFWLIEGVYKRGSWQGDPRKSFRWTNGKASLRAILANREDDPIQLALEYYHCERNRLQEAPKPYLRVDGNTIPPTKHWVVTQEDEGAVHHCLYRFPGSVVNSPVFEFEIMSDTFIPSQLGINSDNRELGIMLSSVKIRIAQ